VPGVTPRPGQQFGRVRQDLYPRAAGGPVIHTPPGQQGFGGPLTVTGWLRGRPPLTRTLAQLGVPPPPGTPAAQRTRHAAAARPAAAQRAGAGTPGWIIAPAAVIAAAALIGTTLWLRRRKPAAPPDGGPRTSESA
jgi:D-alanyl-D-alanine carboxypeptidase (penicillin-binding protein 5/6)